MKMIIDGKKVDSLSGETFDVINPATGKVIESVPKATAEDIDLAVTAAVKGQKEWAKTSVTQRADILHRFVEIVERADPLRRKRQADYRGESGDRQHQHRFPCFRGARETFLRHADPAGHRGRTGNNAAAGYQRTDRCGCLHHPV